MNRRAFACLSLGLVLAATSAHAAEEKKKGGGANFIQIPTLTATVIRPDGRRGVLTVESGLDVVDPAFHTRVDQSQPRLRAAFNQALQIYAAGLPPATAPNADLIAHELQRQTDLVMGRPGAKLLLGTILVN